MSEQTTNARGHRSNTLTRRDLLRLMGLGTAGLVLAACDSGGSAPGATSSGQPQQPAGGGVDFSSRFTAFPVADEPNGDLSKVVWPDFVTQAGPDVRSLYEFQVTNGDLMKYMPCFCGCNKEDGHLNNRDCYIDKVNPDGSVVFDAMAPT